MINLITDEQSQDLELLGFDKAPLKQEVIGWMLEKHHVYGWVEHYWYPLGHRWKACIKRLDGGKAQIAGELKSYEEAMNKCIDMLIEYVKD